MKFSIIIPTFNEEECIKELLPHLSKIGSGFDYEIIVSDGGSTDKTLEIASSHGATVINSPKKRRSAQMNEGARQATGDVLYFLHADTFPPVDLFQSISRTIKDGYSAGAFCVRFEGLDGKHFLFTLTSYIARLRMRVLWFGDQSLFVLKRVFDEIGGYNTNLLIFEDSLFVKEIRRRYKVLFIKNCIITSVRKFNKNGPMRLRLIYALLIILYSLSFSHRILLSVYKSLIRQNKI